MNHGKLILSTLAGLVLLAPLAGCVTTHEQNVNAAEDRYQKIRAKLMLPLARQQLESGDLEQAERTVNEAMLVDPDSAVFYVLSGRIAMERRRLERGIHRFNRAIELNDEHAEAHYYRGVILQRWSKRDEALKSYERAYELEPDRPDYMMAVAEIMIDLERQDDALQLLESKLDYFAHNAGLRMALGQAYAVRGDYPKAVMFLQEAQLLDPDDIQILEELATAQLVSGNSDEAIRHLRRLTDLPSHLNRRDLKRALATAYQQTGRLGEARAVLERLTRQDVTDGVSWIMQAEVAWAMDDAAGAIAAARRAIVLVPGRPEGYLVSGMVWQKRGRYAEALRMYEKAERVAPDNGMPSLLRGVALQAAGKTEAASEAYREALRRQPTNRRAQELLAQVTEASH
ncbi:MAG: hypothetical protein CMJ18_01865 [Phycisphaeraceae bacterium]|nr:hypothetical protein [Phycisphaeraceae bacterium]